MDASALTTENIVATVVAGVGIGVLGIWKYLKELKAPTAPTGDRIIPGLSIADMQPIRDLAIEQGKTTAANERIAVATEGLLEFLREREETRREQDFDEMRSEIRELRRQLGHKPGVQRRRRT